MPAIEEITETLIRQNIHRAVGDVFKTMLGRTAVPVCSGKDAAGQPWPPLHPTPTGAKPHIVGTVGFIGDASGLIYLYLDLAFARLCTCHLLGMSAFELDAAGDEVVNDAIGEITNMTVGSFKNGLCDAGYPCMLTIPSILRGNNFCIEPIRTAARQIYHFDCSGHRVVADILMKTRE